MAVGDLAAEDDGDLVGPTNVTVGIQKSLSQLVAGGAAGKIRLSQYSIWAKKSRG